MRQDPEKGVVDQVVKIYNSVFSFLFFSFSTPYFINNPPPPGHPRHELRKHRHAKSGGRAIEPQSK